MRIRACLDRMAAPFKRGPLRRRVGTRSRRPASQWGRACIRRRVCFARSGVMVSDYSPCFLCITQCYKVLRLRNELRWQALGRPRFPGIKTARRTRWAPTFTGPAAYRSSLTPLIKGPLASPPARRTRVHSRPPNALARPERCDEDGGRHARRARRPTLRASAARLSPDGLSNRRAMRGRQRARASQPV